MCFFLTFSPLKQGCPSSKQPGAVPVGAALAGGVGALPFLSPPWLYSMHAQGQAFPHPAALHFPLYGTACG